MSWSWRDGAEPEHVCAQGFPTQGEAEAWLSEAWSDLLEDGVTSVTLYEEQRPVYGPMDLGPAQ